MNRRIEELARDAESRNSQEERRTAALAVTSSTSFLRLFCVFSASFLRLFCVFSAASLFLLACPPKEDKKVTMAAPPSQVIEGFRMQETCDGRVFYDLEADKAYVYEDSNRIEVTAPKVRFYDAECQLTSTLTADSGSVNSKTSDLVALRDVLVKTSDSTTLETDSLVWRNKDRQIVTDAPVSMHSPNGTVNGVGLVSDADLKKIEIKNTVQATTTIEFQHADTTVAPGTNPASETLNDTTGKTP